MSAAGGAHSDLSSPCHDEHGRPSCAPVDVADLQSSEPSCKDAAQRVNGPEEGLVVRRAHGVDQTPRFSDAQDVWQALGSWDMGGS